MKPICQSDRHFGFTFAGLFLVISAVGWWFTDHTSLWALGTAIGFGAVAWLAPGLLMPLNRTWRWMAPKIASLNNAIILGLVFYGFVTPIGLMMRLFGRDPLHRQIDTSARSYWTPVRRKVDRESFSDQF